MYVNENTSVVVQGITGKQGSFHARLIQEYGTNIAAGVTPGKGGQQVHGIPVFNSVKEAWKATGADTSIVFVPAKYCLDAVEESIEAGILLTCVITEGVPVQDTLYLVEKANDRGAKILGPNCPGILLPGKIKLGIMPSDLCHPGKIALISKSGTLSYEIAGAMEKKGLGLSAFVGVGGDPVRGITMEEATRYYLHDDATDTIVLIGEIGGNDEEKTAELLAKEKNKPVVAYIAGKSAPEGKRMGHAGAIISGNVGSARGKIGALQRAGVHIADTPWDVPRVIKELR